jgi:OmpA-OmpF porin, OOP family
MKQLPLILFLCSALTAAAQERKNDSATLHITVTDSKQQALKKELVVFANKKDDRFFSARTGADGKCSLKLPPGATYTIQMVMMGDTTDYSEMEIPALRPGQYFTQPYLVDIEYDAPRLFTLDHVQFDFGKPTLRPSSYPELNEIAEYMALKKDSRFEIAGHTDNVGKDADNLKLSQARAEAVKAYLVKKGIEPARLLAKGYGASAPVADNSTEEGRQQNRRTEVKTL